ncbi:MAG: nucleotide pyrophosphohydrolase [Actinobacteria bacterium]|uniref:Unannotated protein n=1 Tax=freshwater metagenome TaxID=449393 RepID=A0A6J7FA01_9ZZZZ|nr:nucleotide pyrophosphohydrolase [Actinomycetota bacterium]MSW90184.1 nucleotide pyrophosphohydrolase [Actinomycetota bacterium]MSX87187.1 nucleotide pyrophosphohydrolase [Actinomycetota bacterium]MSY71085.1 nucleotide pyrophosphohydrolase [Actinomycetota bacterium]
MVVGLGPAGPDLLTQGTIEQIDRAAHRYVRTTRHPAASAVPDAVSFDALYEQAASFDDVYQGIVEALVEAAATHGEVLYAVPGSPRVAERSVELLCADHRVDVEVHASLSFLDLAWVRLGVDPLAVGVRIVDGRSFLVEAAGSRGPLLVAQCDARHVLSDIKLAVEKPPSARVTVVQRLGEPDERIFTVAWDDLDRSFEPDHLTSLYIPELAEPVAAAFARFDEQVRVLRAECPWDAEQTHHSLRRHLLEETYEVLEALDELADDPEDGYLHLEEELGDLLYQVFFHSVIAAEHGMFTVADVATGIFDKLERRHPHVFGAVEASTTDDVRANWEAIKRAEKQRSSAMDGLPVGLPALAFAAKVLSKAGSFDAGIDHPVDDETRFGAELLAVVVRARAAGVDAEQALRRTASMVVAAYRAAEGANPDHVARSHEAREMNVATPSDEHGQRGTAV